MTPARPLRVLVDAGNLKPAQGGIASHAVGLIGALADRPELRLTVATSAPEAVEGLRVEVAEIPVRTRGFVARAAWRERSIHGLLARCGADILLVPVPELPLRGVGVPSVVVLHDVGALVAPALYGSARWLRWRVDLGRVCSAASHVVCVSQSALLDLHGALGVDLGKCSVIGEGPQHLPPLNGYVASPEPYLLYVGSQLPNKNVATLMRALAHPEWTGPKLIMSGPLAGAGGDQFHRLRAELGLEDAVEHRGYVDAAELRALYHGAMALVLPSLHEGFGLPVLEAMGAGTPVVASGIPPFREVGGDAVVFVDRPLEPAEWRRTLTRVVADEALRSALAAKGLVRAGRYSWSDVGSRFSELLGAVAARP